MSNELISALENRVTSAVDTIEGLRSEIRVLKEERQLLESKLRDLLQKIEGVENGAEAPAQETSTAEPVSTGFGGVGSGMSHSPSEY